MFCYSVKRKLISMTHISLGLATGASAQNPSDKSFEWNVDSFDDISVLRYKVAGFENLPLDQKKFIYHLSEASAHGRDILFDQNFRYNLAIRRTLEAIYTTFEGDRDCAEFVALEEYLKKVWFASGIHHHYSKDKFEPRFSAEFFEKAVSALAPESLPADFGSVEALMETIKPAIFNKSLFAKGASQDSSSDLVVSSACNYYQDVTQAEAEKFYGQMAIPADSTPISYGLNSKLTKENGQLVEKVWKIGGMYSAALENIAAELSKALEYASELQKPMLELLIECYRSGDLRTFDEFNILWAQNTTDTVDLVCYFTEVYGDPLGMKASWEAMINFKNFEATKRTEAISDAAQWFEDHSPIDDKYKKAEVKGVSAKVITAAMLGGDCYPATPIGINLPNADWIRRDHGSKSVTIENITHAYDQAAAGNGFSEEFVFSAAARERRKQYGSLAGNLHTDLHECLGHGSGQLAEGITGNELQNYGSALEEARADLFALYYIFDTKLVELGVMPSIEVGKTEYDNYILNGIMTQLTRIKLGNNIEQAHMRNRQLIAQWCYEKGRADNVIEKVIENGKTYIVVNDYDKLRELFGQMLHEVQRIKSEGDYTAGKELVETYAVKIDQELHREVLERFGALNIRPYSGFVNPIYEPVVEGEQVVDIRVDYSENYTDQMLRYSRDYSALPSLN